MGYRAAIIGCGRVAWMLEDDPLETRPCTHMGAYLAIGKEYGVEVVAASDNDGERLEAFKERFDTGSTYQDYREMLKDTSPDIVSICAYATQRHAMVMDSIDAGVRGIWCEKALATSLSEARSIIEASRKNKVSIIVSHMRRWSPNYRKVKDIIDLGGIGRLQSVVCHFSGSLMHTGTHAFDVLLWLCGPALWVTGTLEERKGAFVWDGAGDPGGSAVIGFDNGVYATVHAESKDYFIFEFDIIGSSGRIRIGNNEVLEYYTPEKSRRCTGIKELYLKEFPRFEDKNIWVEALGNLIETMEGRAGNQSGPEHGLRAMELVLAIHKSAMSKGVTIELPLDAAGEAGEAGEAGHSVPGGSDGLRVMSR
jgi:predicted dehydrogenase